MKFLNIQSKRSVLINSVFQILLICIFVGIILAWSASILLPDWQGAKGSLSTQAILISLQLLHYLLFNFVGRKANPIIILIGTYAVHLFFICLLFPSQTLPTVLALFLTILLGYAFIRVLRIRSLLLALPIGICIVELASYLLSALNKLTAPAFLAFSLGFVFMTFFRFKDFGILIEKCSNNNFSQRFLKTNTNRTKIENVFLASLATLNFANFVSASAPDLLYDSNNIKAWLPERWAITGSVSLDLNHPQTGQLGSMTFLLLFSRLLGSENSGGLIQSFCSIYCVLIILGISNITSIKVRLAIATLFASLPAFLWQTSGGYDDLWMATILTCCVIGIYLQLNKIEFRKQNILALGIATSAILSAKISLIAPFIAVLGFVTLFLLKRKKWAASFSYVLSTFIFSLPQFLWRYFETGNPLWPNANRIFAGRGLEPINIVWNMPFGPREILDIALMPISSIANPGPWVEGAAPGLYGSIVVITIFAGSLALICGFYIRVVSQSILVNSITKESVALIWYLGPVLLISLVVWFSQFRYLRYLLPTYLIALLILAILFQRRINISLTRFSTMIIVLSTFLVTAYPIGNPAVPSRIPFSYLLERDSRNYLEKNNWNNELIIWLNENLKKDSMILSDPTTLYQRRYLREDLDYVFDWEYQILKPKPFIGYVLVRNNETRILELVTETVEIYCPIKTFKIGIMVYEICNQ